MKYCLVILLYLPFYTFAGAWGAGSFENDAAYDWLQELETVSTMNFLLKTVENVHDKGYLEVDSCSRALASAEIIAPINSGSFSHLPESVKLWSEKYSKLMPKDFIEAANTAINVCSNTASSELAQLWNEGSGDEWKSYIKELKMRLN